MSAVARYINEHVRDYCERPSRNRIMVILVSCVFSLSGSIIFWAVGIGIEKFTGLIGFETSWVSQALLFAGALAGICVFCLGRVASPPERKEV